MPIKKQVFVMSVIYDDRDTYAESAVEAVSHRLFNEDGVMEWNHEIIKEEVLSTELTDEDLNNPQVDSFVKGGNINEL